VTLRRATPADAATLADIQVRTWLFTYSEYVDPERILETAEGRDERWSEILARDPRTIVAEAGGQIGGFVSWGDARDSDVGDGVGELFAIYVAPEAQGAGVGTALHAAVIDELRADGHREATLWVFERNAHARDFYERSGWTPDTGPYDAMRWNWAPSVRYRRGL